MANTTLKGTGAMTFIKFRHLNIGATFRFASEQTLPYSGMKRGLCRKISERKYNYVGDDPACVDFSVCRVGSINVQVYRVAN